MTRAYESDLERARAAQDFLGPDGYVAGAWARRDIEQDERNRLQRAYWGSVPRPQCTAAAHGPRHNATRSLYPCVRAIDGGKK